MEENAPMTYESNLHGTLMHQGNGTNGNNFYSTWEVLYNNFYNEGPTVLPVPSNNNNTTLVSHIEYQDLESIEPQLKKKKKNEIVAIKPRCRKRKPTESKKDLCKKARNSGKQYEKLKGKDKGCFISEKVIGPDCECPNKCFEKVGDETIQKIFKDFWALGDYNSQNAYLFGLINLTNVKRRYTKKEISRRNFTITYSVKRRGQNVTVCKKAFLNIHGLQHNRGRINNLANKMKEGESVPPPDRRGRHGNRPNAYSEEAIDHVRNHLLSCPKIGRKKNSNKLSKQMEFSTKKCYDLYVSVYCKERNLVPVSLDKYRRIYWEEGYRAVQNVPKKLQGGQQQQNSVNIESFNT